MAVLVPVIESIIQGLGQLIQVLETPSFQRQGAQLLPPGFNTCTGRKCRCQVQPESVFGNELQLHFRPGSEASLVCLLIGMDKLSSMINQRSAGKAAMIFSSSCTWLAL